MRDRLRKWHIDPVVYDFTVSRVRVRVRQGAARAGRGPVAWIPVCLQPWTRMH